ncbi:hypothetical protein [Bythopirellula polymerisocia]|uniref:Uncharacterized protein n=1 Tax=Bythopirellula polymerisocia TaxID=2528003 RepID=A0A5C6CVS6_9BACT|nr:hypothetical protein [Bythopirellula polymerisocia]TWU28662.1 hypothetical protein Pla144_19540 [Bythopirellula polymerisocia]
MKHICKAKYDLVKKQNFIVAMLLVGLLATPSFAYEVWMGTHLAQSSMANNLDDWALTASLLDGVNINRAPNNTDPASNNDWRTIFGQVSHVNNTLIPLPRSGVTRDTSQINELAFDEIEEEMQHQFDLADTYNYDFDHLMFYDNATGGNSYSWTETEVQHMRSWLDTNGHQDISLMWNARNFSQANQNWSANSLVDHVMIEGSADDFLNNSNNKSTLLNWLWTNPNTIDKDVILQIPRSENSMTQYASTRRVAVKLGQELGYENGMQSDRLVFLPVTYNDNYDYLPETTSNGTSYTDSLTSLALSLIEQRPLFEGRSGIPTNADADSFVREVIVPTYGTLIAGWDTWDSATNPSASVLAPGVTGSAVTTTEQQAWNIVDGRGASADGTWGTFAGPPTASTVAGEGVQNENLELPNATTGGTITFTITNNGTSDLDLDGFHFDAYAFRPKAARAYELSVSSGAITNGVIYTSTDDEITSVAGAWDNSAHDDISHSLLGLADHTLEVGGSVDFLLAFSSGDGDGSGGHDLWIDNVAITAVVDVIPGDFDHDGDVDGADFLAWQRNDGTPAGLAAWQNNYGAPAMLSEMESASLAVPEPSSVTFLLLSVAAWCRSRKHNSGNRRFNLCFSAAY